MAKNPSDEDLLANAIPIDADELEEIDPITAASGTDDLAPIDLDDPTDESSAASLAGRSIQTFESHSKHEDKWTRTPNTPGTGAIHVKTFVAKLRLDAVEHMDQQINEWLDAHPQYEVKFVTSSVGKLIGKNVEEAIFLSVWV